MADARDLCGIVGMARGAHRRLRGVDQVGDGDTGPGGLYRRLQTIVDDAIGVLVCSTSPPQREHPRIV